MPVPGISWRRVNKHAEGYRDRYIESAAMNAKEWIAAFAQRAGTEPPSPQEFSTLLDLAGVAAHSSERVAAPVACWVAARAGLAADEALALAREINPDA